MDKQGSPGKNRAKINPLLELLNQRFTALGLDKGKYSKPILDNQIEVTKAIRLHSEAWLSDPFAANNIRHAMAQGYILPSEVIEDAQRMLRTKEQTNVANTGTMGS